MTPHIGRAERGERSHRAQLQISAFASLPVRLHLFTALVPWENPILSALSRGIFFLGRLRLGFTSEPTRNRARARRSSGHGPTPAFSRRGTRRDARMPVIQLCRQFTRSLARWLIPPPLTHTDTHTLTLTHTSSTVRLIIKPHDSSPNSSQCAFYSPLKTKL